MNPVFLPEPPFSEWQLKGLEGAPVFLWNQCESTHQLMRQNAAAWGHGAVVVANDQTGGRGRHGRIWKAPADKNLSFNVLISLEGLKPEHWAQLTQMAAITLANLLRHLGVSVSVKWPNDLLCQRHKLCGILSELIRVGDRRFLSLGIGINVNTDASDFAGLDRLATSLKLQTNQVWNREQCLQQFLPLLDQSFQEFRVHGPSRWIEEWRSMDSFLGTPGRVVDLNGVVEGTIVDVNDDGSLKFRTHRGEWLQIWSGDLEI